MEKHMTRHARFLPLFVLALILAVSVPMRAIAGFHLTAAGHTNASIITGISGTTNVNVGTGFGGGVLLGPNFGKGFELEFGASYVQRGYSFIGNVTQGVINASVGFNWHFVRWLGIGAGGFFDYGLSTTAVSGGQAIRNINYGPMANLQINIPVGGQWFIVISSRALVGLANLSAASGGNLTLLNIDNLIGIRWGETKDK